MEYRKRILLLEKCPKGQVIIPKHYRDIINSISKRYNLKVTDLANPINQNGWDIEYITNRSFMSNSEIWLGIFENQEFKLLSFFYCIAFLNTKHPIRLYLTNYQIAKDVWNTTFKLVKHHGITFSEEAKNWAKEQLNSYVGWEEREMTNYKKPSKFRLFLIKLAIYIEKLRYGNKKYRFF